MNYTQTSQLRCAITGITSSDVEAEFAVQVRPVPSVSDLFKNILTLCNDFSGHHYCTDVDAIREDIGSASNALLTTTAMLIVIRKTIDMYPQHFGDGARDIINAIGCDTQEAFLSTIEENPDGPTTGTLPGM